MRRIACLLAVGAVLLVGGGAGCGGSGSGGGGDPVWDGSAGGAAPVAQAGPNQSVTTGATVTLGGTASGEGALTYLWEITVRPTGSQAELSDPGSPTPSFVADLDGTYAVVLTVSGGSGESHSDSVTVSVGSASGGAVATVYEVGPGQDHEDLSSIDWPNLVAGDEVRIHWRQEPYRTKIGLRSRGTRTAPVRLVGIAGPDGARPVISGQNASTPASLNGFFDTGEWSTETIGVITILRGPDDEWGYKPGYIEIEGLQIVGGHPGYRFTGMDGSQQSYGQGASGIHANVVEHLTVRDCDISDNANGFFVLSRGSEEYLSRDILFEKNDLHDNGVVGSDQEHGIYTQASGIIFQYNRIGALRTGANGIALKDRSADTVIRYNWIVSGARTLDLVEPEDSYQLMLDEPGFRHAWVYGNVIVNEYSSAHPHAVNMFHYGGDMGETFNYRKGTLHFFHNTVYIRMDQADEWSVTLFDLSTNEEAVELVNNVFYLEGDSLLYLARDAGVFTFAGSNWISSGWANSAPNDQWHTFAGTVTLSTPPLEGTAPGFADALGHDFSVPTGAAIYDQASPLPAAYATHPVSGRYTFPLGGGTRSMEGAASELGAFESTGDSGGSGGGGSGAVDVDGDGYTSAQGDCLDTDASVHPGAQEICGDGIDQDCSGADTACTGGGGSGGGTSGSVTYSYNDRVYRIEASPGASPEDLSARLDLFAPSLGGGPVDACLNVSPDGQWLVLTAQRGDAECDGWPCLTLADRAVDSVEVVQVGGAVVHPEGCTVAVASGGDRIVYMDSGEQGHDWDLWLTARSAPGTWATPVRLTASSPYSFYGRPSLAVDGSKVVFECGSQPYDAHSVCEVNTDGTGFRVVMAVGGAFSSFRNPDYAPDGSILVEGETPAEQIWRLAPGAATPQLVNGEFSNDNSPCVLPDGSIASLWLERPGSSGDHELKVMGADGSGDFMLIQGVDLPDIGLGCGM